MAGQYPDWWKKKGTGSGSAGAGGGGGSSDSTGNASSASAQSQPKPIAASAVSDPARYYAFSTIAANGKFTLIDEKGGVNSYVDSAASRHFFCNQEDFVNYLPLTNVPPGETANGEFKIAGVGTVVKHVVFEGRIVQITFRNAMHTPDLRHNLISIGCMLKRGYGVMFLGDRVRFLDVDGVPFMESEGMGDGTMFRLTCTSTVPAIPTTAFSARSLSRPVDAETWHRRLGHVAEETVK